MRRIYVSLILVAIFSLFVTGWLIERFIAYHDSVVVAQDQLFQQQMLHRVASELAGVQPAEWSRFLEDQSSLWGYPFSLEGEQQISLPPELKSGLYDYGGLLLESDDHSYRLAALPGNPEWLLQVELPKSAYADLDIILTIAFYLGILLLMLVWLMPLTRRLSLLTAAAQRFGSGHLDARIPPSSMSYISQLERNFNAMANQIGQLLSENQLLTSGLSHDLRTPIACFRFGLDAALEAETVEEKDTYLRRLEQDADRMESMLNVFLEYAGLSRNSRVLEFRACDLSLCVGQIVQSYQPLIERRDLLVELRLPEEVLYPRLNQVWFQRALCNLLSNANRYARHRIRVGMECEKYRIRLYVADDGPGVCESDAERIFQPFYRAEQDSAASDTSHYGLGLAIAAKVVDWHQGSIELDRCPELGGARFSICLPRKSVSSH